MSNKGFEVKQRAVLSNEASHLERLSFISRNNAQAVRKGKADSTQRCSRAVPHPSTNRALRRLTSEVRRDPVRSTRYGRQRHIKSAAAAKAICVSSVCLQ